MQNMAVPMDLSRTRAPNHGRGGQGNFRGGRGQYGQYNNQPTNHFQNNAMNMGNSSNTCFQCEEEGHYARNCPKHHPNSQHNQTANLIDFNDNQNYANINITEEDPVEALQTQLNSLSTENREKLAIAMGGENQQDFPSVLRHCRVV